MPDCCATMFPWQQRTEKLTRAKTLKFIYINLLIFFSFYNKKTLNFTSSIQASKRIPHDNPLAWNVMESLDGFLTMFFIYFFNKRPNDNMEMRLTSMSQKDKPELQTSTSEMVACCSFHSWCHITFKGLWLPSVFPVKELMVPAALQFTHTVSNHTALVLPGRGRINGWLCSSRADAQTHKYRLPCARTHVHTRAHTQNHFHSTSPPSPPFCSLPPSVFSPHPSFHLHNILTPSEA